MRLGMFMMPLHPAGRPMHEYLAEDTEKALLLDRLGYDELFIGEHYSAATEPYPSPMMFAASLLPKTERLVFGTGVINAPLHHPAMIAAEGANPSFPNVKCEACNGPARNPVAAATAGKAVKPPPVPGEI